MKHYQSFYIWVFLFMLSPYLGSTDSTTSAQLNNVVEVEDIYKPTLRDADPISVLPEVETTTTKHYNVDYAITSHPATTYTFQPTAVEQSDVTQKGAPRRYLSLGGGTNGLFNLRTALGARLTPRDQVDFDFALGGYNADAECALDPNGSDWKSRYYRTRGLLRYAHQLNTSATLSVQADLENHAFNYSPESWITHMSTDKQRNVLGGVEARLTPWCVTSSLGDATEARGLFVGATVAYRFYNQTYPSSCFSTDEKCEEMQLAGELSLAYRFNSTHQLGVGVEATQTEYNFDAFDNQTVLQVQPYYDLIGERFNLHLGANLGLIRGVNDDFSVAPQVRISYLLSSETRLFAEATGGIVRNDFRHLQSLTPYWRLTDEIALLPQLQDQVDQVRALVGMESSLMRDLHITISGGYDHSDNRAELLYDGRMFTAEGTRFHAEAALRYDLRDLLHLRLSGTWNHWTSDAPKQQSVGGIMVNLEDNATSWRPILDANFSAEVSPIERLYIEADFGVQTYASGKNLLYERPTTLLLNGGLSYRLPITAIEHRGGSLSLYVRGENLLSRSQDAYQMVRMPDIGVMGGVRLSL